MTGVIGLGHGYRSLDSFTGLLGSLGISVVIDVRTYTDLPARAQFSPASLTAALIRHDIRYRRIEVLSGSREHECLDAQHLIGVGCSNGYEGHMESRPFRAGLAAVVRRGHSPSRTDVCGATLPLPSPSSGAVAKGRRSNSYRMLNSLSGFVQLQNVERLGITSIADPLGGSLAETRGRGFASLTPLGQFSEQWSGETDWLAKPTF